MITWKQACYAVGYTDSVRQSRPKRIEVFYAYKAGTVKECKTMEEARAYSELIEGAVTEESLNAHTAFCAKMIILEHQASQSWEDALRKEHGELSDDVYNLCHSMAYDMGQSTDRDEVASNMDEYVRFANEIIAATKKQ